MESSSAIISTGPLEASASSVDLTDRLKEAFGEPGIKQLPLAGYGKHVFSKSNLGVADSLFVKALSLRSGSSHICLVTADLLFINQVIVDGVMQRLHDRGLHLTRDQLVFGATHTHSAYGGYAGKLLDIPSVGWPRAKVLEVIVCGMADAIITATDHHAPAEMASASRDLRDHHYVTHRIDSKLPTNDWLDVIAIRNRETKASIATVAVFGAHATCHSSHDHRVSGDYPGVLCELLERTYHAPALFLAGSVGSMRPSDFGKPRSKWSRWLGCLLALEAVDMIQHLAEYHEDVALGSAGIELKLPSAQLKVSRDWRFSPVVSGILCPSNGYLQAVRIGDRVVLTTPSDFSGELALPMRDATPGITSIVTSFNGNYVGYILPDEHYDLETYEARTMSILGPGAARYFQTALSRLKMKVLDENGMPDLAGLTPSK
ncbi:neutral/alkaline non-lysosomal ceramidase N-terminal domain-containing protein [bacterium]|nr:neutral/alkaline non-lysosomal ceramidase N-terminal domain-containing protein [bacterium]